MRPDELQRARAHLGLTQAQLADRLGVTLSAVSRWEQGQRRVPELAARLLRLFVAHPNLMAEVMAPPVATPAGRRKRTRGGR
jgi:DNA-binding transcriptional regulator YiaG